MDDTLQGALHVAELETLFWGLPYFHITLIENNGALSHAWARGFYPQRRRKTISSRSLGDILCDFLKCHGFWLAFQKWWDKNSPFFMFHPE